MTEAWVKKQKMISAFIFNAELSADPLRATIYPLPPIRTRQFYYLYYELVWFNLERLSESHYYIC